MIEELELIHMGSGGLRTELEIQVGSDDKPMDEDLNRGYEIGPSVGERGEFFVRVGASIPLHSAGKNFF